MQGPAGRGPRREGTSAAGGRGPARGEDRETYRGPRPDEPDIPATITGDELDRGTLNELRTLPEALALKVARLLVAARLAFEAGDGASARAFVDAAKRRAARVAAVRAAAGEIAYATGDFSAALSDLKAARRIAGGSEYLPMIADCERGLGHPDRAVALLQPVLRGRVSDDIRIEALLVVSGARADLGQPEAAVLVLKVPELTTLPAGSSRARLQYAYARCLKKVGRLVEAREWMHRAAASDLDGATDAQEVCDEWDGLAFMLEDER